MNTITFFSTREELRQLTGLPDDNYNEALWNVGFDLDDWDFGFVSDEPFHEMVESEDYEGNPCEVRQGRDEPYYMEWLLNRMDDWCVGYSYTEYAGKHYYIAHHS
jgi:hypothetical protein